MDLSNEVVAILKMFGVGRRHVDDPFFSDTDKPPARFGVYDLDEETLCHEVIQTDCNIPGCKFSSDSLLESEGHYNAAHRYACSQCRRVLPSPHFLDLHLQEAHDSFFAVLAARRPSYACYIEECKDKFLNAETRFEHCVSVHKLPKDFRFEQAAKKAKTKKNKYKKKPQKMELSEASDRTEELSKSDTPGETETGESRAPVMLAETSKPASVADSQKKSNAVPKNFSFGHSKNKTFSKYCGLKLTESKESSSVKSVNIDEIMTDIRDSLPK